MLPEMGSDWGSQSGFAWESVLTGLQCPRAIQDWGPSGVSSSCTISTTLCPEKQCHGGRGSSATVHLHVPEDPEEPAQGSAHRCMDEAPKAPAAV